MNILLILSIWVYGEEPAARYKGEGTEVSLVRRTSLPEPDGRH